MQSVVVFILTNVESLIIYLLVIPEFRIKSGIPHAYRVGVRGTREESSEYYGIPVIIVILFIK